MGVLLDRARPSTPAASETATLSSVLAEIAETASETLELQEVFERVADAVRRIIPLDHMGVVRIVDGRLAVFHAATAHDREPRSECTDAEPLASWSPRLRPRPGAIPRLDDAQRELDPSFPFDRMLIDKGVRSAMWESFRLADAWSGGVWVCSFKTHAFGERHEEFLRPIAALLGSAVEHWRIWVAERQRQARLDQLEALLSTLAESLDIRALFARVAAEMQPILPHHVMVLSELNLRQSSVRIVAQAGEADIPLPDGPIPMSEGETLRRAQAFEILQDIAAEVKPETERERLFVASGMRSWLRVPVRLAGEVRGSLGFAHREPGRYGREEVEIAARLADRVALVLSHERLAEEARVAAETRERAERLEATVETLTRELESRGRGRVVGVSPSWKDVMLQIGRVAPSETTVLITGESGTGKEIVSRLIRQGSPRAAKPFVAVNCAALPEQLLESELFGHEKGAFTGAIATKIGRLEQAAGGTLFLDEIAEMSPLVQAKFLRVLQEREFQRVGGARPLRADVRVVAATNRDLGAAIERGQFREDLYYRLNVFEIRVPALRDRRQDILPLAESFLDELGQSMGKPAAGISRDAGEWLLAHSWPGNVRELRNAIERAILLCDGGLITRDHLPLVVPRLDTSRRAAAEAALDPSAPLPPGGVDLEDMERGYVERALRDARGNKSRAARLLGMTRAQLYSRIEKYGLG